MALVRTIASEGKFPTSHRAIISSRRIIHEYTYNINSRYRIEACPQFEEDQLIGMVSIIREESDNEMPQQDYLAVSVGTRMVSRNSFVLLV